jgi:hypothetical protein
MSDEDWRLRGQEEYLTGVALVWHDWSAPPPGRAWRLEDGSVMQSRQPEAAPPSGAVEEVTPREWDHDHCDVCWAKFMDSSAGYTPAPRHERFGWSVVEPT